MRHHHRGSYVSFEIKYEAPACASVVARLADMRNRVA